MDGWGIIDEHRRRAREISFHILVWGPSAKDVTGYKLRESIKNHLIGKGHSVKFSEELIKEGKEKSAPDPIHDEILHAEVANLIVVLYGSRGTQIEIDRILHEDRFLAQKSVILIEEETMKLIESSLSEYTWQNFYGKILSFKSHEFNEREICTKLDDFIEDLQFAEYLGQLKQKRGWRK